MIFITGHKDRQDAAGVLFLDKEYENRHKMPLFLQQMTSSQNRHKPC